MVANDAEQRAPYFTIARSLGSMNDLTSTYVVMFELNASVLDTRLKGINLGENGQLQLISPEGIVVSSSESSIVGSETAWTFAKEFPADTKTDDVRTKDEEGRNVLAVYNTLNTNDWKLVGSVQTSELTKDASSILVITLIVVRHRCYFCYSDRDLDGKNDCPSIRQA